MSLNKYLAPSLTLLLKSGDKEDVLKELAAAICRHDSSFDFNDVVRVIADREKSVSSRISSNVALPHAILPGCNRQVVAVGYSSAGVSWDSPDSPLVNLVVMSICGKAQAEEHIHMLADLANTLREPAILERMEAATSSAHVYEILQGPEEETVSLAGARKLHICRSLLHQAFELAGKTNASALMMVADDELTLELLEERQPQIPFIMATGDVTASAPQNTGKISVLNVPFQGLARSHRVKLAFLFALSHRLIDKGDTVICISGETSAGMLHAIEIIDVAEEFNVLLSLRSKLSASDISDHVLDRVLYIAASLAREGREGKPVGAIFILGDYENVQHHCHQLVMNPFRGYMENERNILDPNLEETIKEFSRIDGAFLIRGDGVIMSMGSFIQTEDTTGLLESGLGARHAAAMAITMSTQALSIVISESTRRISLFKRGGLVMSLDQASH